MQQHDDIPQELFDDIEAYLAHTMPIGQREAFAKRIDDDTALLSHVAFVKAAMEAVQDRERKQAMQQWHSTLTSKSSPLRYWLPIAAGVALLATVAWWVLMVEPAVPSGSDVAFDRYARIDPGLPVPMSAAVASYDFYDAMVDYKAEKYDLAVQKWSTQLQSFPENDTLMYYLGAAHFGLKEYANAAERYGEVLSQPTSVFADKARLYMALCYLKLNDTERLRSLLVPEEAAYGDTLRDIIRSIQP